MKEIFERRSVRQYLDKEIPKEEIIKLLQAAMRAPSAVNQQAWEFVVVKDREKLNEIITFHPYAKMLKQADCAVIVCGNLKRQRTTPLDFWVQDCSAATQNLLLEAVHLGIGAVWLGLYPMMKRVKRVQDLFGLPEHVVPLNIISLGYPEKMPEPMDTYREDAVHWEEW